MSNKKPDPVFEPLRRTRRPPCRFGNQPWLGPDHCEECHAAVVEASGRLTAPAWVPDEEGPPPPDKDARLPFPTPPFDLDAALDEIAAKGRTVGRTRREWETAKAIAKELKDEHDEEVVQFEQLVVRLDAEHRDAERRAQQPFLAPVDPDGPTDAPPA